LSYCICTTVLFYRGIPIVITIAITINISASRIRISLIVTGELLIAFLSFVSVAVSAPPTNHRWSGILIKSINRHSSHT
jgi:hypothetical protein